MSSGRPSLAWKTSATTFRRRAWASATNGRISSDSARHGQQIEAGRAITVTTLLRICEAFEMPMAKVVRGLDAGIYEKPTAVPPSRRRCS